MSKIKHSGENVASVTVQMRFILLKTDPEQQKPLATILVHVDDTQKGTPDNLQELKLPIIQKLELEGETFIQNKVKLINTIFIPKGWTNTDNLTKRLDKYAMFMTNQAKMDFAICQQKARGKFLSCFNTINNSLKLKLTSKQNDFLEWLGQPKVLKRLRYAEQNSDNDELKLAYEKAVMN